MFFQRRKDLTEIKKKRMKIGIQITNKSSIDDEPMFNVVVVDRINFIEQVKRNISKKYPLVVKKLKF